MQKIRSAVKRPLALLVFLAVMAHLAPIMLLASSINLNHFRVFDNRDEYLASLGTPQLSYNFNDLIDGRYRAINFGGMSIVGDMLVDHGAVNFSGGSGFAVNFDRDFFAWGADITPLGGGGLINFAFGGQSAIFNVASPGFVGFAADFGFRAINASFGASEPSLAFIAASDASGFVIDNVIANSVPEPTTLLLLATGAGLLGASHRRRKQADEHGQDQGDGGQAI
jgi:hypothetical protein